MGRCWDFALDPSGAVKQVQVRPARAGRRSEGETSLSPDVSPASTKLLQHTRLQQATSAYEPEPPCPGLTFSKERNAGQARRILCRRRRIRVLEPITIRKILVGEEEAGTRDVIVFHFRRKLGLMAVRQGIPQTSGQGL